MYTVAENKPILTCFYFLLRSRWTNASVSAPSAKTTASCSSEPPGYEIEFSALQPIGYILWYYTLRLSSSSSLDFYETFFLSSKASNLSYYSQQHSISITLSATTTTTTVIIMFLLWHKLYFLISSTNLLCVSILKITSSLCLHLDLVNGPRQITSAPLLF